MPTNLLTKGQLKAMFLTIQHIAYGKGINKNLQPEEQLEIIIEACKEYISDIEKFYGKN